MTLYEYELIHRPISLNTQPKGYVSEDLTHINRNGFNFGSVSYDRPLTQSELDDYQLEPVHVDGLVELTLITKSTLADNGIRLTIDLLTHLIVTGEFQTQKIGAWEYIDLESLKQYAFENISELKIIYKNLKKHRLYS